MKDIRIGLLLTPREHRVYLGGTPLTQPTTVKEWDIPEGVRNGFMSIDTVREARNITGHTGSLSLQAFFGFEHRMGFTLPPLNKDGTTESDPRIVELDHNTGEVIKEISPEEEARYYEHYKSVTENPPPDREVNTSEGIETKG